MMSSWKFVCVLAVLLRCGSGQDPATVCYNPTFTALYFNIITQDTGRVTVDFSKQLYNEVSDVSGVRVVHDFHNLKSYVITQDAEGNLTCKVSTLSQNQVMYRCLPPYAKPVKQATGQMGYTSNYKMIVQTWEVESDFDTVSRITLTTYSSGNMLPAFLQELSYHGTTNAYMYFSQSPSISDKKVFDIPSSCSTNQTRVSHVLVG